MLSYGVLSSKVNINALGKNIHKQMLKELDVDSIHANVLGVDRLTDISSLIRNLQKKLRFNFYYYFIDKISYALVVFLDSVFDAGLNQAVKWDTYWTPLRFLLIHKLSILFDEEILKESWSLCINKNIKNETDRIVTLLSELLQRVNQSNMDDRSKEIISDAFRFGIKNPLEIDFGTYDQKIISPNSVGFQFVISSMAERLNKLGRKNASSSIIIDQQAQFNRAQITTHYNSVRIAEGLKKVSNKDRNMILFHPLYRDQPDNIILRKGTPTKDITISSSANSIGLQIVDIYLWIVNRVFSDNQLSSELVGIIDMFLRRSMIDGISMEAMARRYSEFEKKLPNLESLTTEQINLNQNRVDEHRSIVRGLKI